MASRTAPDVSDSFLWHDQEVYRFRHEQSAAYLAAIRELVAEEDFGGATGAEFLRVYDRLAAADPVDFTAVWSDPAVYLWVRVAYQLLGAHFGSVELSPIARTYLDHYGAACTGEAAERHLAQFKLFAAGLAVRTGDDRLFELPLTAALPVVIPGTRLALLGAGDVRLLGVRSGRLVVRGRASVSKCPLVRHGHCELRMQAAHFRLPGIGYGDPLREAGPAYQHEQAERLAAVLAAVERYAPEQLEQLTAHMQVVALKPAELGEYSNVSHSELPGACVLTVLDDPLIMADRLIHELYHNRLFCLEEQGGAFFDNDQQDGIRDARFYSPWRDEPRPLHGILHAMYVFQPVWRFWQQVRAAGSEGERTLAFADDQLRRILRQLELAAGVLAEHAVFTPFGRTLFSGICRGVDEICALASRLEPHDAPAWTIDDRGSVVRQKSRASGQLLGVHEAVHEHALRFEQRRQAEYQPVAA